MVESPVEKPLTTARPLRFGKCGPRRRSAHYPSPRPWHRTRRIQPQTARCVGDGAGLSLCPGKPHRHQLVLAVVALQRIEDPADLRVPSSGNCHSLKTKIFSASSRHSSRLRRNELDAPERAFQQAVFIDRADLRVKMQREVRRLHVPVLVGAGDERKIPDIRDLGKFVPKTGDQPLGGDRRPAPATRAARRRNGAAAGRIRSWTPGSRTPGRILRRPIRPPVAGVSSMTARTPPACFESARPSRRRSAACWLRASGS